MNERREAVVFENRRGEKLFGVFHRPADGKAEVAVLMLSPGVKMRVGPHGLYNHMTESLVAKRLAVLRFDFHGLGDSEGDLTESRTAEVYNAIQSGRYVEDTLDAADWMAKTYGFERFLAAGLCGGAITGLLAARQDDRIDGLLSLGIPVSFEGGEADYGKFLTRGQLKTLEGGYVRNLKDPLRWLRLLTFRSNFRVIGKVLMRRIREKLGRDQTALSPSRANALLANLNHKFPPAFFHMLTRRCPMLMLFGGTDRWEFEFTEKFEQVYADMLEKLPKTYEKIVVPEANHIFSKPTWRNEMQRHVDQWLSSYLKQPD